MWLKHLTTRVRRVFLMLYTTSADRLREKAMHTCLYGYVRIFIILTLFYFTFVITILIITLFYFNRRRKLETDDGALVFRRVSAQIRTESPKSRSEPISTHVGFRAVVSEGEEASKNVLLLSINFYYYNTNFF